jgi:hypothetical protein
MRHPYRVQSIVTSILILNLVPLGASAAGNIEGTVTFWGDPGGGTQIEIAAHTNPGGLPDASVFVSTAGGAYSIPVADGTYYVSALMARDGVFGEPRREDVLVWYDADGDGHADTVTVSGGAVTDNDIDIGFVYVDIDATGANDGSSWTDAFTDLQDGIDLAVSGIEVWVAEGTYVPGAVETNSFATKSGVRVYGGFAGGETVRQQRDWNAHPTILSGEIGGPEATDNCRHVVSASGSNSTSVLNGVTITRGYADQTTIGFYGGGVSAWGGGVTLVNVTLIDNFAHSAGGAAYASHGGVIKAYNCRFINNRAPEGYGGGYWGDLGVAPEALTLVNCVFDGNSAFRGGALHLKYSNLEPVLVNLTISGNTAEQGGGGMYFLSTGAITLNNCIIWGNTSWTMPQGYFNPTAPTINSSIYEGGWTGTGTGNLDADPSFRDADLQLDIDSPAIDAGDSTALPLDLADLDEDHVTDEMIELAVDRDRRLVDDPLVSDTGVPAGDGRTVDIGAYESSLIIWDDFESGTTSKWSSTVGS